MEDQSIIVPPPPMEEEEENFEMNLDLLYCNGLLRHRYKVCESECEGNRRESLGRNKETTTKGSGNYSTVYTVRDMASGHFHALKVMRTDYYKKPKTENPTSENMIPSIIKSGFEDRFELNEILEKKVMSEIFRVLEITKRNLHVGPIIHYGHNWKEEYRSKNGTFFSLIFLLMEEGESDLGRCLLNKMRPPTFIEACRVLNNLSNCLVDLKKSNLEHGDLKIDNLIVMDKNRAYTSSRGICISDFGFSAFSREGCYFAQVSDLDGLKSVFNRLKRYCPDLNRISTGFHSLTDMTEIRAFLYDEVVKYINDTNSASEPVELFFLNDDLKFVLGKINERVRILEVESKKQKEENKKIREENKELREENKKLREENKELREENKRQRMEIEELKEENKELNSRVDRLEKKLEEFMTGKKRKREEESTSDTSKDDTEPREEPPMKKRKLD